MKPSTSEAGLPPPEQTPALPMPAHHRPRREDPQMPAPVAGEPASEEPQHSVPSPELPARARPSGTSQDSQLMAQEQVLEHEVLARAHPGQDCHEQQPEEFEHVLSIADSRRSRYCRPTTSGKETGINVQAGDEPAVANMRRVPARWSAALYPRHRRLGAEWDLMVHPTLCSGASSPSRWSPTTSINDVTE
jgi:hypothetical protein